MVYFMCGVIESSLVTGFIAMLFLLARPLWGKRTHPLWLCVVWGVFAAGFLLPPLTGNPFPPFLNHRQAAALFCVWLAGAAAFAAWQTLAHFRLYRMDGAPPSASWPDGARRCCAAYYLVLLCANGLNWFNPLCWWAAYRGMLDLGALLDAVFLRGKSGPAREAYASSLVRMTNEIAGRPLWKRALKERARRAGQPLRITALGSLTPTLAVLLAGAAECLFLFAVPEPSSPGPAGIALPAGIETDGLSRDRRTQSVWYNGSPVRLVLDGDAAVYSGPAVAGSVDVGIVRDARGNVARVRQDGAAGFERNTALYFGSEQDAQDPGAEDMLRYLRIALSEYEPYGVTYNKGIQGSDYYAYALLWDSVRYHGARVGLIRDGDAQYAGMLRPNGTRLTVTRGPDGRIAGVQPSDPREA